LQQKKLIGGEIENSRFSYFKLKSIWKPVPFKARIFAKVKTVTIHSYYIG